jgi:hypothetical protein
VIHVCGWFLQSVIKGVINLQLTCFSDEAEVHLQGCINTHSNHYWSSQNPHLTHEVLHSVKVGVWCAINARRIVGPVFFSRIISCKTYLHFFPGRQKKKDSLAGFSKMELLSTLHVYLFRVCPMSLGTVISAVVFG